MTWDDVELKSLILLTWTWTYFRTLSDDEQKKDILGIKVKRTIVSVVVSK